jgi:hypothetical protein
MPTTRDRVPLNTAARINLRIQRATYQRVRYYSTHRAEIAQRLRELDGEWDIERAIEANAAAIAFAGIALSVTRGRHWLAVPALVTGFLFQHAVQGWCPPVPLLRRLGFRTSYEIEEERQALKALRGDFEHIPLAPNEAEAALDAARA